MTNLQTQLDQLVTNAISSLETDKKPLDIHVGMFTITKKKLKERLDRLDIFRKIGIDVFIQRELSLINQKSNAIMIARDALIYERIRKYLGNKVTAIELLEYLLKNIRENPDTRADKLEDLLYIVKQLSLEVEMEDSFRETLFALAEKVRSDEGMRKEYADLFPIEDDIAEYADSLPIEDIAEITEDPEFVNGPRLGKYVTDQISQKLVERYKLLTAEFVED